MAQKKSKTNKTPKQKFKASSFKISSQQKLILGSFLVIFGILLFIAFISFFFNGKADQSILESFPSRTDETQNWVSQFGAWLSNFFIQRGFGVSAFIFSGLVFLSGVYVLMDITKTKLRTHWFWGILIMIWFSIIFGFFGHKNDILGGTIGFEINSFLQDYLGKIGTSLLLLFGLITYLAIRFKLTFESFTKLFKSAKKDIKDEFSGFNDDSTIIVDNNLSDEAEAIKTAFDISSKDKEVIKEPKATLASTPFKVAATNNEEEDEELDVTMEVEEVAEELSETDNLANKLVEDFGQFDPTLELAKYQFPPLDLLKKYVSLHFDRHLPAQPVRSSQIFL